MFQLCLTCYWGRQCSDPQHECIVFYCRKSRHCVPCHHALNWLQPTSTEYDKLLPTVIVRSGCYLFVCYGGHITREAARPKAINNDASVWPPNQTSALYDLDDLLPWPFAPELLWVTQTGIYCNICMSASFKILWIVLVISCGNGLLWPMSVSRDLDLWPPDTIDDCFMPFPRGPLVLICVIIKLGHLFAKYCLHKFGDIETNGWTDK